MSLIAGFDVIMGLNPRGYSGQAKVIASAGNYKKTIPLRTNGTVFKRNIEKSNLGFFFVREVIPNIVTAGNATIDITTLAESNLNVAIYDLAGSKIMDVANEFVNENSLVKVDLNNLSNLATGSYVVVVTSGNDVAVRKFIKQ
jgi:hypothetical protein